MPFTYEPLPTETYDTFSRFTSRPWPQRALAHALSMQFFTITAMFFRQNSICAIASRTYSPRVRLATRRSFFGETGRLRKWATAWSRCVRSPARYSGGPPASSASGGGALGRRDRRAGQQRVGCRGGRQRA